MITPLEKGLLALMIFVIMLGMGATLDGSHFRYVARKPKAFVIGLLSQFCWMPLVAFGLASFFGAAGGGGGGADLGGLHAGRHDLKPFYLFFPGQRGFEYFHDGVFDVLCGGVDAGFDRDLYQAFCRGDRFCGASS